MYVVCMVISLYVCRMHGDIFVCLRLKGRDGCPGVSNLGLHANKGVQGVQLWALRP